MVQTGFEEAADGLDGARFVIGRWLELRRPFNRTGVIAIVFHTQFADVDAHRQRGYFHSIAVAVMLGRHLQQALAFRLPAAVAAFGHAQGAFAIALAIDLRQHRVPIADRAELADLPPERVGVFADAHGLDDFCHRATLLVWLAPGNIALVGPSFLISMGRWECPNLGASDRAIWNRWLLQKAGAARQD